jgi:dolichyl-phosphate-mannose-protein mannosyltransferase
MRSYLPKHHRLLFYLAWLILTIIQSRYTELLDDEAYYWVYSKFLDWGYFDHPPMVAALIKAGYFVFHNELGVRLAFLVLNTLSLLLIEQLLDKKNPLLFYGIVLSLAVLQVSGFVAVPDTPLIFFTALFFWCYRKFLDHPSLEYSFLLGLITAALLYSKYHAVLIIFFVLISNLKLFARYQTYVVGVVALVCFAPHLWWQYQHDWVSFRYHLFESNVNPYRISHTLDYIVGQILLAGPFAGVILLPAAFLYHSKTVFERSLKFTLIGIYAFFLLSSFRGKVEANWTSPAIIPLIILSHNFLSDKTISLAITFETWLFRILPITVILVLCARLAMIFDILPIKQIKQQYHGWQSWPQIMKEKTAGLPVVFENSYQRASKYWFYSGQMTYSLNWYRERRNNYNFWPIEDSMLGKPVFIMDIHNLDSFQSKIETPIGLVGYKYDSAFSSFAKVKFTPTKKETINVNEKLQLLEMTVKAELPAKYYTYIINHPTLETQVVVGLFDKHGWVEDLPIDYTLNEMTQRPQTLRFLNLNLHSRNYYIVFSIYQPGTITGTHNSEKIRLVVR